MRGSVRESPLLASTPEVGLLVSRSAGSASDVRLAANSIFNTYYLFVGKFKPILLKRVNIKVPNKYLVLMNVSYLIINREYFGILSIIAFALRAVCASISHDQEY